MRLRTYDLVVQPASPLHVGSGEVLQNGVDLWVERERAEGKEFERAFVIDEDKAFAMLTDREVMAMRDGRLAAHLGEERRKLCTRYSLRVIRTYPGAIGDVRQFQRDMHGTPYIPGTGVKGALRTALLFALSDRSVPGQPPQASKIEQGAFGTPERAEPRTTFANRDINRAIRVSDLQVERDAAQFALLQARVAHVRPAAARNGDRTERRSDSDIPVWCEAALLQTRFHGILTIEEEGEWMRSMSEAQRAAIDDLPGTLRKWAAEVIAFERNAWNGHIPQHVGEHFANMEKFLERGQPLALLGWGTGWHGKTIGPRLTEVQVGSLAEQPRQAAWKRPATFPGLFPATRKLIADTPMGWVRVTMTPR
jgi:CRISPR type III-A-associated RAMP protein Csm5